MVRGLALSNSTTFLIDLDLDHSIRDIVIVVRLSPFSLVLVAMEH